MHAEVDRLVEDFERGRLTRRQLTARLTVLIAAVAGAGRAAESGEGSSTFRGVGLNHIALDVTDIPRSRDFYVQHLGLSVARESAGSCFLTCGDNFVALFRSGKAGMNHYCYSIEGYDVETAAEKLREHNLEPRIAGRRIYFKDPEGLTVQLAAPEHRP